MPVSIERNYGKFPLDCGLRRNDECILPGNDLSRTVVDIRRNDDTRIPWSVPRFGVSSAVPDWRFFAMSETDPTFASKFHLEDASFAQRLKRDIKLLVFLFMNIWQWATAGRRARREFKQCRQAGKPFYVDKFDPARKE
jgi:hypothetical protein